MKYSKEIESRFTSHVADQESVQKMMVIRHYTRELARIIEDLCPLSREKQTALTQLSFVMMSANSAIVQVCPINRDEIKFFWSDYDFED